ncbi:MAG: pseudouridine synthase [Alphaproteobacteria bacterium]
MREDNHKDENNSMRIAKRMAHAGLCSRRDAEAWIAEGRVSVNGEVLTSPAFKVSADDAIVVDGKRIGGAPETRLFLYHKPAGLVTTHKDEHARGTVFDVLARDNPSLPRVVSVGRLDLNTEGLLLLTNDGGLSRYLELPATGWSRKYRVRVNGRVNARRLAALKDGITVEGVRYGSIEAQLEQAQTQANAWISMTLREGKNREIRRVMEALNLKVNRLIRVSYGPFNLGKLPRGEVVEVNESVMKAQLSKYFKGRDA